MRIQICNPWSQNCLLLFVSFFEHSCFFIFSAFSFWSFVSLDLKKTGCSHGKTLFLNSQHAWIILYCRQMLLRTGTVKFLEIPWNSLKFLEISPILTYIGQVVTGAALACSSFILVSVATSRTLTFVGVVCASLSSGLGRPLFQCLCFALRSINSHGYFGSAKVLQSWFVFEIQVLISVSQWKFLLI